MEKNKYIELRKKLVALAATGAIAITGCGAKTNTNNTTSNNTVSIASVTTTTEETTTTQVETHADIATVDYMNHAKAVTKAIYDANKEYFDERQYTPEDLENVYYVLNGKYYAIQNDEKIIIMDRTALERALRVILELVHPQRVDELERKLMEVDYELKDINTYKAEVEATNFFKYSETPLINLIDKDENNSDTREYLKQHSIMLNQVQLNLINGVSPEEIIKKYLVIDREGQTGNISSESVPNNIFGNTTTTRQGERYIASAAGKAKADLLSATTKGHTVALETKDGKKETIVISFPYEIQYLVNASRAGELTDDKERLEAMKYRSKQYQEFYFTNMCASQDYIVKNFGYEPVKGKNLTK